VFTIGVPAVEKLSSDDSQPVTAPIFPVKVSVPEFVPEQTVAAVFTAPPTDTVLTVIVAEVAFAEAHTPLFTMAR
jgi:hypothetical protein